MLANLGKPRLHISSNIPVFILDSNGYAGAEEGRCWQD